MRGPNDRMNQIIQFMCFGSMIEEHFYHHVWGPFECPHRHCEYICLFICHSYWYFMCMFPSPSLSLSIARIYSSSNRIASTMTDINYISETQCKAKQIKANFVWNNAELSEVQLLLSMKNKGNDFSIFVFLCSVSLSLSLCVSILLSFDAQFCLPFFVCGLYVLLMFVFVQLKNCWKSWAFHVFVSSAKLNCHEEFSVFNPIFQCKEVQHRLKLNCQLCTVHEDNYWNAFHCCCFSSVTHPFSIFDTAKPFLDRHVFFFINAFVEHQIRTINWHGIVDSEANERYECGERIYVIFMTWFGVWIENSYVISATCTAHPFIYGRQSFSVPVV